MWEFLKAGLYARWITTYDPVRMIWWLFRHYGWLCFITLMVYTFEKELFKDHLNNVRDEAASVREGVRLFKAKKVFDKEMKGHKEKLLKMKEQLNKEYEDM